MTVLQSRAPGAADAARVAREIDTARPADAQVEEFTKKLRAYRDTLPEDDQRLLNAMYFAAMGKHEEKDEDTHAYWVTVARPYAPVGWAAAPWGVAYGAYYSAYW